MTPETCIDFVPVTPEYVLAVKRDLHRQARRFDYCCDGEIDLTLDSTIEDWRNAMDLLPARQLGRAMNEAWGIHISDREWSAVLSPARRKTLRDVAELISLYAVRPQLRPLAIAGTQCLPAAAFLAIKDSLAKAGADVSNVAPSTRLAEFARRYPNVFMCDVARFAPGTLPDVDLDARHDDAALSIGCVGFLCGILGLMAAPWIPEAIGLIAIALFLQLLLWFRQKFDQESRINSVEFGELRTFRDLAKCIAAGAA